MSYKLSKELFEAVINVKLTTDLSIAPYYNEVNGCEEEDLILINYNFIWIPLDTFFFKCKEYAFCNGYELMSGLYSNDNNAKGKCIVYRCEDDKERVIKIFNEDDELQAVFDACQWIMDKDKQ